MHIRRCIWCCDGGRWKPIFGSRPQRQRYLALDWDVALGKDDGGLDAEQDADVEENKALGVVIAFGVAACEGASDLQDVHGQSYDAMPRYGPCRPPRPAGRQCLGCCWCCFCCVGDSRGQSLSTRTSRVSRDEVAYSSRSRG